MQDLFKPWRDRKPSKPVDDPRDPPPERPDWRDGREFDPCDPTDGKPRMMLTWVQGEGLSIDIWNLATVDVMRFYVEAGASVAGLIVKLEGEKNGVSVEQVSSRPAITRRNDDLGVATERTRALIAPGATTTEE